MKKAEIQMQNADGLTSAATLENPVTKELSPAEEYKQGKKKRRTKRGLFVLFILVECILCEVFLAGVHNYDLNRRVNQEGENATYGKIDLLTGPYTGETDFGYFFGEGFMLANGKTVA